LPVVVAVMMLPVVVEAQHFELDDVQRIRQQEAAPNPPSATQEDETTEYDVKEPEEAPGLLGFALHGRDGLTAEYIYTGEVFTSTRGGKNTNNATEYRGNFDLVLTADLDEMGFFPGGTFFIYGQNGHGRGLTGEHVCDCQTFSNIDAPDFVQVS
jgi:hypothetical protein